MSFWTGFGTGVIAVLLIELSALLGLAGWVLWRWGPRKRRANIKERSNRR